MTSLVKYIRIDGRKYGPKSLEYHIRRSIARFKYFKANNLWDEQRQREVKKYIERYTKIFEENFSEEDSW
ncbi:hypothetical protein [uncultured Anaerococcus sp.]|uniref:hypothetical protein n=1 Tax=uncultured Anaerococcus sp. TaxID=293428 RepID=UPI0025FBDEC3|nr:hypothetical protein [uncultured Anaerococcus sp.]